MDVPDELWEELISPSLEEQGLEAAVEDALLYGDADERDAEFRDWDLDLLLAGSVWLRDEAELSLLLADPPTWMTAPTGAGLAAALDGVRLGSAAPVVLVEAMKAGARMRSWCDAFVAAAMAAFWRRRQAEAATMVAERDDRYESPVDGSPDAMWGAAEEIAAALRLSPRTVQSYIDDAVRLTRDLPDTFRAVRSGEISMSQARVILDATEDLLVEGQQRVEERVLRRAPEQTQAQLRAACRRAVASVDSDAADKRHARAVRARTVRKQALPDGMAGLWFTHTADVVESVWVAVNGLADAAKVPAQAGGDGRSVDERRADAMAAVFRAILDNGVDLTGRALPAQHRRRPHIEVLVPATTLLGVRDDPAELVGYGPIPPSMARRIAAGGTWRRLLTDPATGVVLEASTTRHDPPAQVSETVLARDQRCRWRGCRMPARRCDRDHGVKYKRTGRTRLGDLCCLCEFHHRIKDNEASGWHMVQLSGGVIEWTSPTGHTYRTDPPAVGPIADHPPRGRPTVERTGDLSAEGRPTAGAHDDDCPPF